MRLSLALLLVLTAAVHALDTVSIATIPDIAYEQGEVPAKFRVSRGSATNGALPVQVAISGTATTGVDYTIAGIAGGWVTIPDGSSTVDITITPDDDGLVEMRETVVATIVDNPSQYLRGAVSTKTMLIADNDLRLRWQVLKEDASEFLRGGVPPEAAVRLVFDQAPPESVIVQFQLLSQTGAANLGTDFMMTYMHRTLVRDADESILTDRSVTLNPTDETWTVGPKLNADAVIGAGVVRVDNPETLMADDRVQIGTDPYIYYVTGVNFNGTSWDIALYPPLQVAAARTSVVRNNPDVVIQSNGDIQGFYLHPDQDAVDLAITPIYDNIPEGGETVTMRMLASPDYLVVSPTDVELTIADDDVLVSIAAIKDAIESPRTNGIVRLTLSSTAPKNIAIPLDFSGSAAVAGLDFAAIADEVVIPQGSNGVEIEIEPLTRAGTQGPRELSIALIDTTDVVLAGAGGGAGPVAVINIRDGTAVSSFGTVTIQGPATAASEDPLTAVNLTVRAARSGASNPDLTVPVVVSGSAIPGVDYVELPATVTLPGLLAASTTAAGSSFMQVVLNTSTIPVTLPAGSTLRVGSGTNVRVKTEISVGTTPVYVELTAALSAQVSVGTTIGVTELLLPFTPIADSLTEGTEVVNVLLTQPGDANYTIGGSYSASVSIMDSASEGEVVPPKPGIGSGSSTGSGCGAGGASALLLAGLGLGFALRRRRR